jgi:monomeric sarcosine oxidase
MPVLNNATKADVIVIGAGIHGVWSAYELAKAGRSVILLEQFSVGHDRGSSHGTTRIIRYAYDHPEYVRLVAQAFGHWHELEDLTGVTLIQPQAHLDLARPDHPVLNSVIKALKVSNARYIWLSEHELQKSFPLLRFEGYNGVLDLEAGLIQADVSLKTLLGVALQAGVQLFEQQKVLKLELSQDLVQVRTANHDFSAAQLVLAAGAWTNILLELLGLSLPLQVLRTQAGFFQTVSIQPTLGSQAQYPIFFDHHTNVYGIPESNAQLKIGNRYQEAVDPDRRSFEPIDSNLKFLGDWINQHMLGVSNQASSVISCLYTFTPDEDFIVDTLPNSSNAVVINACSGHGYKFAPVIGEMAKQLLAGQAANSRFSRSRFEARP